MRLLPRHDRVEAKTRIRVLRSLLRHVDHDTGCDELPHGNLSRRAATFGEMDGRIEMRPTVLGGTK